jgi:hypothetical protein
VLVEEHQTLLSFGHDVEIQDLSQDSHLRSLFGGNGKLKFLAYLQGKHDVAVTQLRRAVKGLPESPDVHCHLGLAELAAGRKDLGRWHLAAAVSLAEKLKADGSPLSAGTQESVRRAKEELARIGRSSS